MTMKKFKFKLNTVLKYKKILKDKQLTQYNRALEAYNDVENQINRLDQEQQNIFDSMVQSAQAGFNLSQHQGYEFYNQKIIYQKNLEKVRLAKRRKLVQVEQKKLIDYSKDEKGIEILKDNTFREYKKELLAEEIKEIDDIVCTRFRVNDN